MRSERSDAEESFDSGSEGELEDLASADSAAEAIEDHIAEHLGPIDHVLHEIVSEIVHLDVHVIAPSDSRPYRTFVTTGMSDLPMAAPSGHEDLAYSELLLALPSSWEVVSDDQWYWPVYWLKLLARFPHENAAWIWEGHSMASDDPPRPLHESVGFEGVFLSNPRTTPDAFRTLRVRDDKIVHFHAVYPIYPGEMQLKLSKGSEELDRLLDRHGVTELIDPGRKDVSRKGWWRLR